MKKIIGLLLFVLLYSCGSNQNLIIKYNNEEPSERQKLMIREIKNDDEFIVFFDSGFLDDKIVVVLDGIETISDSISTDNSIGGATSYNFSNSYKKAKVIFNQKDVIEFKIKSEYPFINIKKEGAKIHLEYRKVFKSYK